jgi:DNA-binding response OmpR family regulator
MVTEPRAPAEGADGAGRCGRRGAPGPILVVDDEPYVLRWLTWHLTRAGYRVATAVDGEAGLARARALRPPLIFLDAKMPRLDGFAVCAELRRDPALAGTHVILFSAAERTDEGAWERCDGLPDEYLVKPCPPGEVVRRARAVLGDPYSAPDFRRERVPAPAARYPA